MRVESVKDALVLHVGIGEWYNQRVWGMCEDVNLPPALWHAEVETAIRSYRSRPSVVVIDATEMTYLVAGDYGFFFALSQQLKDSGTELNVVARIAEVEASTLLPLQGCFKVVGTLEEALRDL